MKLGHVIEGLNRRLQAYLDALPKGTIEKKGFDPSKTSLQQVPAGVNVFLDVVEKIGIQPDSERFLRNLDYGGGKYNFGKREFRRQGVVSQVYDLYSRTKIHNKRIKETFRNQPADTVTIFNVLNVVKEDEQISILKDAMRLVKKGGAIIIYVHKAEKKGLTSKGTYQEGKPLESYAKVIEIATGRPVQYVSAGKKFLYVIK